MFFFVNSHFQKIIGGLLGIPKTLSQIDKVKSIFIVILRDDLSFSLVENFTDGQGNRHYNSWCPGINQGTGTKMYLLGIVFFTTTHLE